MVPGLTDVRKARVANPAEARENSGGGFRCLCLYLEKRERIHLLILHDKNEQEVANEEQRRQIRECVGNLLPRSRKNWEAEHGEKKSN
jgi:hypothetical protein